MPVILTPSATLASWFVSPDFGDAGSPDIWFDAIDHVEMDKDWFDAESLSNQQESFFDAQSDLLANGIAPASSADASIPFTEDCRRCIKELIRHLGEIKERELMFAGLRRILPGLPADVIATAHSLYIACTEKSNIDIAALNTLGLATSYLLDQGNMVSRMAHFMRETILDYLGQSSLGQLLSPDDQQPDSYLLTGLAVLAIVARHWITDEAAPQRRILQAPAFLGHLLLRASRYWNHLGHLAQHAAATCRITSNDPASHHNYLCTEELNRFADITKQKVWLCIATKKETALANSQTACPFPTHPSASQQISQKDERQPHAGTASSTASGTAQQDHSNTLLAASATTAIAASTHHRRWNNGVIHGATLALGGTVALIGGRFIRDAFFSGNSVNDSRHEESGTPSLTAPLIAADHHGNTSRKHNKPPPYITTPPPAPLFRNRLLGYLHARQPFPSHQTSNHDLAKAALRLLHQDEKYQTDLAHIALYGTGFFGEKHDENLDPAAEELLVGNLLSKLLFNHYSLEDHLLNSFAVNRRISAKDFQKKIVDWSFENPDLELRDLFNLRFLFPAMAISSFGFPNDDPADENSLVMVGSPTWFFTYIGAQFIWSASDQQATTSGFDEMTTYGMYIYRLLKNKQLVEGSRESISLGIKLAGLFFNPEWTPETLPELQQIDDLVSDRLRQRIKNDTRMIQEFDAIKVNLEKASSEPWHSRGEMAKKLMLKHCGNVNAPLYRNVPMRSPDGKNNISRIARINQHGAKSTTVLKSLDQHVYCKNPRGFAIKIPTLNYSYKKAIHNFVEVLKAADIASFSELFSGGDLFSPEFPYDDYQFIQKSALTELNITISRSRDTREMLTFGTVVQTWKAAGEYLFFNATYQAETRSYITKKTTNNYWIKRLDPHHLMHDLRPYFTSWPPDTLKAVNIVFSANKDGIKTSHTESISVFIARLVDKKYSDAEEILYVAGYEKPAIQVIAGILKDVFIPFYSCITSLQKGDADSAVVSCVLDSALTLAPFIKGGALIISKSIKATGKKILVQLATSPNFIAAPIKIRKNTIRLKNLIPASDIYTTADTVALGKSTATLIAEALDPGISLVINSKKMFTELAQILVSGNILKMSSQLSRHWKNVIEASVRTKSLSDSRKILIGLSRINNRGSDFNTELFYPAPPISFNHTQNLPFIALIYHDGAYYNVFRLSNSKLDILASETGEISSSGGKIYAMLSARTPTGIFIKYICTDSESATCELTPWLPAATNAPVIEPSRLITLSDRERWVFKSTPTPSSLSFYPDHQILLSQDGYRASKLCEIFEINDAHYLFDPLEPYLRPLHGGDHFSIVARERQNRNILFRRNLAGNLIIALLRNTSRPDRSALRLEKKYALIDHICAQSDGVILAPKGKLIANIKNKSYPLRLAPIRNQFIIDSIDVDAPSFKVGWSSKDKMLIPAKPYIGESSVHTGISLEDFIRQEDISCTGSEIKRLSTELLNGALLIENHTWLKVKQRHYRLGQWREDLYPLYCSDTNRLAAWLRYDLFSESFEIVHQGDDWNKAKEKQDDSAFEKLAKKIFLANHWSDFGEWINLTGQNDRSPLMLRLRQTAFLQSLNWVDRMELLSLPAPHVRSWFLPGDTRSLQKEYPALALGLSQHIAMAALTKNAKATPMRLAHQIPLRSDLLQHANAQEQLISGGNGDHEAIWLHSTPSNSTTGILLKIHHHHFYGERITTTEAMTKWIPDTKYAPAVSVIQFTQEMRFQPEPLIDIYGQNLWISHVELGLLQLWNDVQGRRINYVLASPDGNWIGLIDSEKYLSLFYLRNSFDIPGRDARFVTSTTDRQLIPRHLHPHDLSLCFVSDAGKFHYPGPFTWHQPVEHHALWSPPPGFKPALITPDQRFLGFQAENQPGILMYDQQRKKQVFLRHPASGAWQKNVAAVAFSPMNAVVALAFSDAHVYLYDVSNEICSTVIDPIAHLELPSLCYMNHTTSPPYKPTIVMRFQGFFQYLAIIYGTGTSGTQEELNKKQLRYELYELISAENPPANDSDP
jgi:hypothetical protein